MQYHCISINFWKYDKTCKNIQLHKVPVYDDHKLWYNFWQSTKGLCLRNKYLKITNNLKLLDIFCVISEFFQKKYLLSIFTDENNYMASNNLCTIVQNNYFTTDVGICKHFTNV